MTTARAGTERFTTEPAQTTTSSPMVMRPTITECAPMNTRLPMVAGWDGLLPQWFTRLHERYQTPVNSIVFVGAVTLAFSILGLIGVGNKKPFNSCGTHRGFSTP